MFFGRTFTHSALEIKQIKFLALMLWYEDMKILIEG